MPRSRSSTVTMATSSHVRPTDGNRWDEHDRRAEEEEDDDRDDDRDDHDPLDDPLKDPLPDAVPVETLVKHLLAARRALGTIAQVLRGNALATEAHDEHADSVVLAAQTAALRRGLRAQVVLLRRLRRGMGRAYDGGRRAFRTLLRTLDGAHGQLEHTMAILRATTVAPGFRPAGEAAAAARAGGRARNLLDFVDETGVAALQDAIKASIAELQAAQTSFDGDLLRFDTDLRALNKAMRAAPPLPPPLPVAAEALDTDDAPTGPAPLLLTALTRRSHVMAENLASLTRHFDLCVTAVRTTDGGAALARYRAGREEHDHAPEGLAPPTDIPVSLSGVLAEQDAAGGGDQAADHAPLSARDRAEMLQVVLQDAAEVDEVVADTAAELQQAEAEAAVVRAHHAQTKAAFAATVAAIRVLDDVGDRLDSYAAAEAEFGARWAHEQTTIAARLADMDALRAFYEGYANAYDTLILEAARRRTVEARIQTVWRKARDAVDRLVVADAAEREAFRQEVGEYLPTDLWVDMGQPPRGHDLFAAAEVERERERDEKEKEREREKDQQDKGKASRRHDPDDDDRDEVHDSGPGGSSTRTVLGR